MTENEKPYPKIYDLYRLDGPGDTKWVQEGRAPIKSVEKLGDEAWFTVEEAMEELFTQDLPEGTYAIVSPPSGVHRQVPLLWLYDFKRDVPDPPKVARVRQGVS